MVAWRDIGHNVAIELLDSITLELTQPAQERMVHERRQFA
jgi:hypothetical protein